MGSNSRKTFLTLPRQRIIVSLSLVGFAVALCVLRAHTWSEPPETDLSTYWIIAKEILHGRRLYSELWDIKPPAIYWTYTIPALFTSNGALARYFLWSIASILTLFGSYRLSQHVTRSTAAALMSSAVWTVSAPDCLLEANQPNTEVFINAALVWGIFHLLKALSVARHRIPHSFFSGFLFGLATLYKTVCFAHVAIFLFVQFSISIRKARMKGLREVRTFSLHSAVPFLAGVLCPWAVALLSIIKQGALESFLSIMITWNAFYSGNALQNLLAALHPSRVLTSRLTNILPAILLGIIGAASLFRSRRVSSTSKVVLAGWCLATLCAVALPGRFYPHYYQLWLPVIGVLSGTAILWARAAKTEIARQTRIGLISLCISVLMILQSPYYGIPAAAWSYTKYGDSFILEEKFGKFLRPFLKDTDFLYVWGTAPPLYEAARGRPASGVFFAIPLLYGPTTETLTRRALREIEISKPEIVVFDRIDVPAPSDNPIIKWFAEHYVALPDLNLPGSKYLVCCRKTSQLLGKVDGETSGYRSK